MTRLSKALTVFLAAAAIAFLGFAGVATFGGPNWRAMAESMQGYKFVRSVGENPQWTVSTARGDSLKTTAVLPEAIVAALDDRITKQREELAALGEREQNLPKRLEDMQTSTAADLQALDGYIAAWQSELQRLRKQYHDLSVQVVQAAEQAIQIEGVVQARRGDVFRLQDQVDVVRTDEFRIQQIQRQMRNLIEQINGSLDRAEQRRDQLKRQLEGYAPAAGGQGA